MPSRRSRWWCASESGDGGRGRESNLGRRETGTQPLRPDWLLPAKPCLLCLSRYWLGTRESFVSEPRFVLTSPRPHLVHADSSYEVRHRNALLSAFRPSVSPAYPQSPSSLTRYRYRRSWPTQHVQHLQAGPDHCPLPRHLQNLQNHERERRHSSLACAPASTLQQLSNRRNNHVVRA